MPAGPGDRSVRIAPLPGHRAGQMHIRSCRFRFRRFPHDHGGDFHFAAGIASGAITRGITIAKHDYSAAPLPGLTLSHRY
jgi:hypothetical protein